MRGKRSVLPERASVHRFAVAHQRSSLVAPQVLAILALDGHPPVLRELQEEVLRRVPVRTHQPAFGDVPELPVRACGTSQRSGVRVRTEPQGRERVWPRTSPHFHILAYQTSSIRSSEDYANRTADLSAEILSVVFLILAEMDQLSFSSYDAEA